MVPRDATSCVLLAIRHGDLTEGIRNLLATVFDSVVMVADEGSLYECAESLRPDLAVVDLAVGEGGGTCLIERLRARYPATKVLVVGADDPAVARAALNAGADGYLRLSALGSELLPAVERLLAGRTGSGAGGERVRAPDAGESGARVRGA
jgi:DNA-binding NarL/FixJ family response regulator